MDSAAERAALRERLVSGTAGGRIASQPVGLLELGSEYLIAELFGVGNVQEVRNHGRHLLQVVGIGFIRDDRRGG